MVEIRVSPVAALLVSVGPFPGDDLTLPVLDFGRARQENSSIEVSNTTARWFLAVLRILIANQAPVSVMQQPERRRPWSSEEAPAA